MFFFNTIRSTRYVRVALLTWTALTLCSPAPSQARETKRKTSRRRLRTADLWLINTRELSPRVNPDWRCGQVSSFRNGGYRFASAAEFDESLDPAHPICIYIHGNRQSPDNAMGQGLVMYEKLVPLDVATRFVVWSWPSKESIKPYRQAAERADSESILLAQFIAALPPSSPITIVGYSYGARTAVGCCHLLGGGAIDGYRLADSASNSERLRPRCLLFASAFARDWLAPGNKFGCAIPYCDRMVAFYNREDPALRRFSIVFPGQRAFGVAGVNKRDLGAGDNLLQFDVTAIAGDSHSLYRYTDSPRIIGLVHQVGFLD